MLNTTAGSPGELRKLQTLPCCRSMWFMESQIHTGLLLHTPIWDVQGHQATVEIWAEPRFLYASHNSTEQKCTLSTRWGHSDLWVRGMFASEDAVCRSSKCSWIGFTVPAAGQSDSLLACCWHLRDFGKYIPDLFTVLVISLRHILSSHTSNRLLLEDSFQSNRRVTAGFSKLSVEIRHLLQNYSLWVMSTLWWSCHTNHFWKYLWTTLSCLWLDKAFSNYGMHIKLFWKIVN